MGEETAFENGGISDFQGLVTLTSTLDRVILHTVMHHSSTSTLPTYQISLKSKKHIVDGRTDGRTLNFETYFIGSRRRSRPNKDERDHVTLRTPVCSL